jgi:hypothetical protein
MPFYMSLLESVPITNVLEDLCEYAYPVQSERGVFFHWRGFSLPLLLALTHNESFLHRSGYFSVL